MLVRGLSIRVGLDQSYGVKIRIQLFRLDIRRQVGTVETMTVGCTATSLFHLKAVSALCDEGVQAWFGKGTEENVVMY